MNGGSDRFLEKASYLSLQNITLGYTLPESITPKSVIQKVRFYASVNDLPAISNYPKGYDPEWRKWKEFIMTSYVLGVNVTF